MCCFEPQSFCWLNSQHPTAFGLGTAFTRFGRLNNSGAPANGSYDLAFTLYATDLSGSTIAGPVTNLALIVSHGLFITYVDFGPGVFAGASNWLQLAVSPAGANSFTTLATWQPSRV